MWVLSVENFLKGQTLKLLSWKTWARLLLPLRPTGLPSPPHLSIDTEGHGCEGSLNKQQNYQMAWSLMGAQLWPLNSYMPGSCGISWNLRYFLSKGVRMGRARAWTTAHSPVPSVYHHPFWLEGGTCPQCPCISETLRASHGQPAHHGRLARHRAEVQKTF